MIPLKALTIAGLVVATMLSAPSYGQQQQQCGEHRTHERAEA